MATGSFIVMASVALKDLNMKPVSPRIGVTLAHELRADLFFTPDEDDASAEIARGLNRTGDLDGRSVVASHGVHSDSGEHSQ